MEVLVVASGIIWLWTGLTAKQLPNIPHMLPIIKTRCPIVRIQPVAICFSLIIPISW